MSKYSPHSRGAELESRLQEGQINTENRVRSKENSNMLDLWGVCSVQVLV